MSKKKLIDAENLAKELFKRIEILNLITAGKTESELNTEIFHLAEKEFGIKKYWHKRIVRSGANTLSPYAENPPNLIIEKDDIIFIDFGPILDEWEADLGRTYVVGNDRKKIQLKNDIESAWFEAYHWFHQKDNITGVEFWNYIIELTEKKYGYKFGGTIAGHLIGKFPHEKIEKINCYIHSDNINNLKNEDQDGDKKEWILELHFIEPEERYGAFFEQLLT